MDMFCQYCLEDKDIILITDKIVRCNKCGHHKFIKPIKSNNNERKKQSVS